MTYQDRLGQAKQDTSDVSSKNEAKKLAFYLFWNIKPFFDRNYILPEDLEHFYMTPKEAQEAFEMLDISGDGQITLKEIRDSIVTIYKVEHSPCHGVIIVLRGSRSWSPIQAVHCLVSEHYILRLLLLLSADGEHK